MGVTMINNQSHETFTNVSDCTETERDLTIPFNDHRFKVHPRPVDVGSQNGYATCSRIREIHRSLFIVGFHAGEQTCQVLDGIMRFEIRSLIRD